MSDRNPVRGKKIRNLVVVAGLLVALLVPLDFVLCRSTDGYSAVENAWSGCCSTVTGSLRCAPAIAPAGTHGQRAGTAVSGVSCSDIRLGAAAHKPSPAPAFSLVATAALFPVHSASLADGQAFSPGSDPACGRQLRDILRSTVLTL
jgi:hypothetical protein